MDTHNIAWMKQDFAFSSDELEQNKELKLELNQEQGQDTYENERSELIEQEKYERKYRRKSKRKKSKVKVYYDTSISSLKKSSRIGSTMKVFTCRYCSKKFIKRNELRRHERIHTGEKPFICALLYVKSGKIAKTRPVKHFIKLQI
ncbi:unnamed protein product, partial [Meganyctiphanes norvegica]